MWFLVQQFTQINCVVGQQGRLHELCHLRIINGLNFGHQIADLGIGLGCGRDIKPVPLLILWIAAVSGELEHCIAACLFCQYLECCHRLKTFGKLLSTFCQCPFKTGEGRDDSVHLSQGFFPLCLALEKGGEIPFILWFYLVAGFDFWACHQFSSLARDSMISFILRPAFPRWDSAFFSASSICATVFSDAGM